MNTSCSESWQEDPTPESQKACQKCGLYKQGSRMIWGEGNPNAPIMIILDNPGAREDREGDPIVCGTRQTLRTTVSKVGLDEELLYVTYILKRRPLRTYDKEQVRSICIHHLEAQLQQQQPSLVVCLGNVAVQSFFQNPEVDVKGLRGQWHKVRGFQTAVAYHPLAVRRRPNVASMFEEDLLFVAEAFRGMETSIDKLQ
ncbi:uracil-DNA glycosylase [Sporosarcina sp. GW1-11]|uniref:uracil-DNA glycosylase n=1 Tax=Sporosarcina sp. GW1-11 TaxID=2899126 RepID=UPI00294C93CB|nr:uracil-DNA glycosylase [Sporosarcina sp. GW1-11]MDV6379479.1 uracil-DNA glycosylase [Sporosarcina sp. GW1-11]